jgi:hypothetical protein
MRGRPRRSSYFIDSLSPLTSMRSAIKMNHFTVYKRSGFQVLHQVHDLRNVGQAMKRTQLFQKLMSFDLVHGCVHDAWGNRVETDTFFRKLDR